jgi:hypothetical protein
MVAATNDYPVTQTLAANATRIVDVFVDIGAGATTGQFIIPTLAVTARGAVTGNDVSVTVPVTGQTMTVTVGTLTMVRDPGTPASAIVIGGTTAPVARYRFTSTAEEFTITDAKVAVMVDAAINAVTGVRIGAVTAPLVVAPDSALAQTSTSLAAGSPTTVTLATSGAGARFKALQRVTISSGTATVTGSPVTRTISSISADTLTLDSAFTTTAGTVIVTPINGTATFSGTVLTIPRDGSAVLAVEAVFNTVTVGAGDSGDTPIFSLTGYTARSASGAITGPVHYGVSPLTVAAADSNAMTLRRTAPTVTLNPAALSNALGGADHEVLRVDIAAHAVEDVDVREIRVTPTITGNALGGVAGVSGSGGIAVFQGGVLRGRVMNVGETIASPPLNVTGTTLTVAAGALTRYQIGQRVTISAADVAATAVAITALTDTSMTFTPGITDTATTTAAAITITAAGFNTGLTYRVPMNVSAAVVAKGTSSLFAVRAETTGLTTPGNSVQFRILEDATASTAGNLIWREGTAAADINGNLVRDLPITGPALIRP